MSGDTALERYDAIIVDEVHERHLTTDFVLALLRAVSLQRPQLRLIIMSATINHELLSDYFGGAPVLQVPGRLHPIKVRAGLSNGRSRSRHNHGCLLPRSMPLPTCLLWLPKHAPIAQVRYLPPDDGKETGRSGDSTRPAQPGTSERRGRQQGSQKNSQVDPSPYLRLLQQIDQTVSRQERGDLLVFLAGTDHIRTVQQVRLSSPQSVPNISFWILVLSRIEVTAATCPPPVTLGPCVQALEQYASKTKRWIILPLHAGLPVNEQDLVFDRAPAGVRKCILSTNVAEASITIDGIRFVADSGTAKHMVHDPVTGVASLQLGGISQASADQRKGRAGRTGPGVFRAAHIAQHTCTVRSACRLVLSVSTVICEQRQGDCACQCLPLNANRRTDVHKHT